MRGCDATQLPCLLRKDPVPIWSVVRARPKGPVSRSTAVQPPLPPGAYVVPGLTKPDITDLPNGVCNVYMEPKNRGCPSEFMTITLL